MHNKKGQGVEAEMAVAVVDEAVLALTGFKTPTLEQLTRFDGPLGVFTGDLRALLLHQTPFYLARNDILHRRRRPECRHDGQTAEAL